ncbi:DUF896 domain-containing protein [Planococcus glaciei]|uniref:DUF896 domain-containing protein n=1 Tax=Planococcus glaciei TaxID=459472 RepID=UPI0009E4C115|nr:DUF896 domain-containing protein [Planococcus glaciei]
MITCLNRINELAALQKTKGLTKAEQQEQKQLRTEYLAAIRGQVISTVETIKVIG